MRHQEPDGLLYFYGIDSWNRPVFIHRATGHFYGSTERLFDYGTSKLEVLLFVTEKDLIFFGREFDCEPRGGAIPKYLKISDTEYEFGGENDS